MKRSNLVRSLVLSAMLAAGAGATPAFSQINFNIIVAPPAPQYETVPVMAPGYVWAPGYWGWNGDRHIWVHGRTIVQRAGYRWEADRWEHRGNGYYRHPGYWKHESGYKAVKVKKQKKLKHRDHDGGKNEHGHGNSDNRGKGDKHDR